MMPQPADTVTVAVPRRVLSDIFTLAAELTDRTHPLLERNANGALSDIEKSELDALVRIAQFGQIVWMAMQPREGS